MNDRYRVSRVVQRGGMAELLEAYVRGAAGFERRVAIKRLLPALAEQDSFKNGFIDEARIISQLQHDNIVTIFDFGTLDGLPIQVLEFVDGIDLTEVVTRARKRGLIVRPAVALYIVAQVARGLEHLHRATGDGGRPLGLVHRDISPDNILVSFSGGVKIVDFGIAFSEDRLEQTLGGSIKGKPAFMAPEQAAGNVVGPRADLYALGLVLHFLLTGKSPLEDEDARLAVYAKSPPTLDARLDESIASLLEQTLAFDERERLDSPAAFAEACIEARRSFSTEDPSTELIDFVLTLRDEGEGPPAAAPFADLFDFELTDGNGATPVRRFTSVVAGAPALSIIGATVHGFRVVELIGRGQASTVYLAQHAMLPEQAALKVYDGPKVDPADIERFSRCVASARSGDLPGVIAVKDCGTLDDGTPFLLMALASGHPIRPGDVPSSDGPSLVRQLRETVRGAAPFLAGARKLERLYWADGQLTMLEPGLMQTLTAPTVPPTPADIDVEVVELAALATGVSFARAQTWMPRTTPRPRRYIAAIVLGVLAGAGVFALASRPTTPPGPAIAAAPNTDGRSAAERNAAERNAAERNAAERNAAERNAAERNAANTNAADTNAADRNSANKNAVESTSPRIDGPVRAVRHVVPAQPATRDAVDDTRSGKAKKIEPRERSRRVRKSKRRQAALRSELARVLRTHGLTTADFDDAMSAVVRRFDRAVSEGDFSAAAAEIQTAAANAERLGISAPVLRRRLRTIGDRLAQLAKSGDAQVRTLERTYLDLVEALATRPDEVARRALSRRIDALSRDSRQLAPSPKK